MLNVRSRTGKELHDLTLSQLIEEYKKVNSEGGKVVNVALDLGVLELKKDEVNSKLKEYEDYASEIAKEFIKRFSQ